MYPFPKGGGEPGPDSYPGVKECAIAQLPKWNETSGASPVGNHRPMGRNELHGRSGYRSPIRGRWPPSEKRGEIYPDELRESAPHVSHPKDSLVGKLGSALQITIGNKRRRAMVPKLSVKPSAFRIFAPRYRACGLTIHRNHLINIHGGGRKCNGYSERPDL